MKSLKYTVDKFSTTASECGFYWAIWFENRDVVFWTEESANKACEMFNLAENLMQVNRKVNELKNALKYFTEEDN